VRRWGPSMNTERICAGCLNIRTREMVNENIFTMIARGERIHSGNHVSTRRGDHVPYSNPSHIETWDPARAYIHGRIYSLSSASSGDRVPEPVHGMTSLLSFTQNDDQSAASLSLHRGDHTLLGGLRITTVGI
jgi:hypothetical protein